jgi:glycosyltransferase involved in cell wall biosynthesis
MRILLVGNYAPDGSQSMHRYGSWLERVLAARGHHVTLVRPPVFFSRLACGRAVVKYAGYLDKFLLFPLRLRRLAPHYQLVHVLDQSNSMYLAPVRRRPNLITCHDLIAVRAARGEYPNVSTGWSGRLLQRWILSGLRGAAHVLCVSSKTAGDFKSLAGGTGAAVRVVTHGPNWSRPSETDPAGLLARFGLRPGDSYLFHVGDNSWYKNKEGALRIFARLSARAEYASLRLVFAGTLCTAAMRAIAQQEKLAERVVEAGRVSNDELQALYSHARALLFPSFEEGLGLPILEAQACGCPVITTARPPMSEIAGEAAVLIDPSDPEGAAAVIAAGLKNRESLRAAGFANLRRFEEESVVDRYCAFYEEIVQAGQDHLRPSAD